MDTTMRRVRRRQRSDTLTISNNVISASEAKEVGLKDMMNNALTGRPRRIVISNNDIKSDKSWSVGISNLFNNYCNLSVVVIFRLVVVALILLGLWTKWATRPTTLLTQGEMSRLTILINYDGRWVNSTYENCKTKGVLVSDKITVEELRKKVYNIVNVDPNEYEIIMKVIYEAMKTAWPAEIADDDDVRAFISESLSSSYKIPLCITLKGKVSNQQAPSVDVGQESMPVTQLDKLLCENMQCEDMAYIEADNIFQDNAEFNEYSRMKILQKGFYDFQGDAAKMDSHVIEWADKLVQENNTKMLSLQDTVAEIAMKWTKVLRPGALGVRFMGVDLNTIMFNMERGQDTTEMKVCVEPTRGLQIKIGDQDFRRPGDSPLEEVVEKLQNEKRRVGNDSPAESNRHLKEELYLILVRFPTCNIMTPL